MRVPRWTIKARLILTLGLACALLAAVGVMGLSNQQHSNVALRDMYMNKLVPATELGKLLESYGSDRAAALRAASSHNATLVQKAEREISKDRDAQRADWKRISAVDLSASERAVATRFAADRNQLEQDTHAALSAMQASNYKGAEAILDGKAETHYQAIKGDVLKLFDLQSSASAASYHADEARAHLARILSFGAIGTGLGASLLLSILLIRSLTRSLEAAVHVADSIADGQLNNRIEIRSDDELGRLLKALQRMDHRLTEIVGEVNRGSAAVSVAAGQIAQGTDDLSQRTQEQASSLEETAASMEEMTSTVKHNADNAAQADQLARGARRQAEEGGEVVREAVDAMNAVSESSKRIADIVGLIDEIAFQTNLLSLNAAVEAARAGEQGRGFAVVATEVRNLAQRSANAAREIKTLINDSVERVRVGQGLVDRSGVTLSEIVESVKKVTDIVAEMAAASAEQSTGIDQVNTAVMTMDEVTQQNSALVEESAAASRAMQEQADALLKTVGYFRFDERARVGTADAPATQPAPSVALRSGSARAPAGAPVHADHGKAVERMVEEALVAG